MSILNCAISSCLLGLIIYIEYLVRRCRFIDLPVIFGLAICTLLQLALKDELEELEASDKNNEEIGAGRQKVSGPYSLPVFAIALFLYSLGESDVYFLNTVEK